MAPGIAYYPFDGKLIDSVGGHDATASGGPLFAAGALSRAVMLDGSDDFLTLPSDVSNSQDLTIAVWVLWGGGNAWQRVFDFGNDTNQNLFLTPSSGSKTLRFAIKNGGPEQILETDELPSGKWIHLAITLNGDVGTMYVDGEQRVSGPITLDPSTLKTKLNYVGKSQYAVDALFNGMLDELHIYDSALSAQEVAKLYAPPRPQREDAGVVIDAGIAHSMDAAVPPDATVRVDAAVELQPEAQGCSLDDRTHNACGAAVLLTLLVLGLRKRQSKASSKSRQSGVADATR